MFRFKTIESAAEFKTLNPGYSGDVVILGHGQETALDIKPVGIGREVLNTMIRKAQDQNSATGNKPVEINIHNFNSADEDRAFCAKHTRFTGCLRTFHQNGKKAKEENFLDGEFHGLCRSWYDNGKLSSENNFYCGRFHGHCTDYDSDGSIYRSIYKLNHFSYGRKI